MEILKKYMLKCLDSELRFGEDEIIDYYFTNTLKNAKISRDIFLNLYAHSGLLSEIEDEVENKIVETKLNMLEQLLDFDFGCEDKLIPSYQLIVIYKIEFVEGKSL